jgi:PRTRC genetic system protein D
MLAADAFRATQIHGDYTDTPQYLALARGALRMMKVETIDLLVVGLPVAAFAAKKAALEKLMTGRHDVGGGKVVTVRKALAMAQPNGALIDYATQNDKVEAMEHEQSLVIDPGSRTFDWLVARGMKLSHKQSHSVDRGVSNILQLIADDVSQEIGKPYTNLDSIDLALRTGKGLTVYQRTYNIARMKPMVEIIAKEAVAAMAHRIGESYNVQHVILVGGGAFPVQEGGEGSLRDAPDPGGQGPDVRQRQGLSDRRHQLRLHRTAGRWQDAAFDANRRGRRMNHGTTKEEPVRLLFEMTREDNPRLYDDLIRFNKGTKRVNRLRFLAHEGLMAQPWGAEREVAAPGVAARAPAASGVGASIARHTNQAFDAPSASEGA